ncbi:hypothetical protein [Kitasatospora azatica]|uniref:hypothetical protein n=1 Tax=Kitasatospora azatica TaxID=58347 RepID=UPI00056D8601|nr:hypothetical protein [Kitasatospora azatica]
MTTGAAWLLILTAAALRFWPGRHPVRGRAHRPLSPIELGLLRGGTPGENFSGPQWDGSAGL